MKIRQLLPLFASGLAVSLALSACAGSSTTNTGGTSEGESSSAAQTLTGKELLADARFRQALKLAIDMPSIIDGMMSGKADAANTIMAPSAYKPTTGLEDWEYDPEEAKALLEEIGWDSSTELDLVYYYGDQATVDFMAAVQQYLSQVGIKVVPRKLEGDLGPQLWSKPSDVENGPSAVEWDLAYAAIAALAPQEYYQRFLSTYSSNSYFPKNDEFESLILATNESADSATTIAAFTPVVEWDNENLPAVPLYYQPVFVVQSDRLDRADAEYGNEQYNYDWKITEWTVPEENGQQVLRTNGGAVDFFETPFYNPGLHMSTKVLYDHLLVADSTLTEFSPQLAESYEVSDDNLTITFKMRDGVTWHDGEALTADDVKFTYELATQTSSLHSVFVSTLEKLEGYQEFVDGTADEITGISVDGNTVTFTFTEVDPNALLTFSQLPPLPEHLLADADPLQIQQDEYFQNPVGSGPFKISDVRMGDYTKFEAWDEYWGGRPEIDVIEMYPSTESDPNLVKNAQAGDVDYAYTKSVDDATAIEAIDSMTLTSVDVMYTRLFFVNQFPRE